MIAGPTPADPDWLPDRLSGADNSVTGVAVSADSLRRASFLDGREPFGEPTAPMPVDAVIDAAGSLTCAPVPMIFHVSFCRSTLLSRLLDIPGATRVLREPRIQIDLADRLAARPALATDARFRAVVQATTRLLGRAGAGGEVAIVKPTAWANNLLPMLLASPALVRPVFVTMAPRAFLRAVFRGGRDRLAFTLRAAEHFAAIRADGRALVAAAIGTGADPLDRAARLTLLSLRLQLDLFGEGSRIDEAEIAADPIAAAVATAALLDVPLGAATIGQHAAAMLAGHAKSPAQAFSADREAEADRVVEAHHGARFDQALAWGERALR